MKKLFLTGIFSLLIFSCSKKEGTTVDTTSSEKITAEESAKTNLSGEQLIERLDCSGCHSVSEKMIGPSYQEIAGKYSDKDIELLASKIIEGGSGVWGNVPMTPHTQVSKDEAKKMVEYILRNKK